MTQISSLLCNNCPCEFFKDPLLMPVETSHVLSKLKRGMSGLCGRSALVFRHISSPLTFVTVREHGSNGGKCFHVDETLILSIRTNKNDQNFSQCELNTSPTGGSNICLFNLPSILSVCRSTDGHAMELSTIRPLRNVFPQISF